MLEKDNIDVLIVKYLKGTISEMENRELGDWLGQSEHNRLLFEQLTDQAWVNTELQKIYDLDQEKSWAKIAAFNQANASLNRTSDPVPIHRVWKRWTAAASVVLLVSLGGYLFFQQLRKTQQPTHLDTTAAFKHIKAPEKNRAAITLSDGNIIYLDSIADGTITRQQGADVVKQAEGILLYRADPNASELVYNTLFNPRGSKIIQVILSDGTKVWLNNETTMRYPANFTGDERRVEITGEAYFEVAKMASRPFRVVAGKMNVEVLGTHFNINAYADENIIRTTLMEGKVKVSDALHSREINPGQQASYIENTPESFHIEQGVDLERVIAWKEGMFQFDEAELPLIMRQISRWYDRDIVYDAKPSHDTFGGAIGRQLPLSDVLHMLEGYGIRFRLENNKIVVKPL